jgi:hypothetical protein
MEQYVITFMPAHIADKRNTATHKRVYYTANNMEKALAEFRADHKDVTVIQCLLSGAVEPRHGAKIEAGEEEKPSRLPTSGELTSEEVGKIAARALRNPASISEAEIQALAGSCLTQRPDRG